MAPNDWDKERFLGFLSREERDNVEFKSSIELATSATQRAFVTKLCKHVGAFLNGDGGVILIGLEEGDRTNRPDFATSLSPGIPRKTLKAADLESMICDRIHPSVGAYIKVYGVEVDEKEGVPGCAFVVEIRGGITAYQSPDKMYYVRRGHSSEAMEDKDIRLRMLTERIAQVRIDLRVDLDAMRKQLAKIGAPIIRGDIPLIVELTNSGMKTIRHVDMKVVLEPSTSYLSERLAAVGYGIPYPLERRFAWPAVDEPRLAFHPDDQLSLSAGTIAIERGWDDKELKLAAKVICYLEDAPSAVQVFDVSDDLKAGQQCVIVASEAETLRQGKALGDAIRQSGINVHLDEAGEI